MKDELSLPEEINYLHDCQGNEELFVKSLYQIFEDDFILNRPNCDGIRVDLPLRSDIKKKFEIFWHVITKIGSAQAERNLNIPRAQRLPWIKPLLEAVPSPHIKYWRYEEGNGKIRRYIWTESVNYIIILEENKSRLYLVTAFNVESKWKKEDLLKKYDKRIR